MKLFVIKVIYIQKYTQFKILKFNLNLYNFNKINNGLS